MVTILDLSSLLPGIVWLVRLGGPKMPLISDHLKSAAVCL